MRPPPRKSPLAQSATRGFSPSVSRSRNPCERIRFAPADDACFWMESPVPTLVQVEPHLDSRRGARRHNRRGVQRRLQRREPISLWSLVSGLVPSPGEDFSNKERLRSSQIPDNQLVGVHREEQEIHHKVTKDTKASALFFLVTFGGESISLAFGKKKTGVEKPQRNQSHFSAALWSYLPAPGERLHQLLLWRSSDMNAFSSVRHVCACRTGKESLSPPLTGMHNSLDKYSKLL